MKCAAVTQSGRVPHNDRFRLHAARLRSVAGPQFLHPPRLLELPHRDLVADVVAQLHQATDGPLSALRVHSRPEDCIAGPTFEGVAITADLMYPEAAGE